jgi:hypothetical protein
VGNLLKPKLEEEQKMKAIVLTLICYQKIQRDEKVQGRNSTNSIITFLSYIH